MLVTDSKVRRGKRSFAITLTVLLSMTPPSKNYRLRFIFVI